MQLGPWTIQVWLGRWRRRLVASRRDDRAGRGLLYVETFFHNPSPPTLTPLPQKQKQKQGRERNRERERERLRETERGSERQTETERRKNREREGGGRERETETEAEADRQTDIQRNCDVPICAGLDSLKKEKKRR